MKKCSRCGTEKPVDLFRKRKNVPSGHCGVCKSCESEQRKGWGVNNRKKDRAAVCRYHNKHRAYFLIRYASDRAAAKGWAFDLDAHRSDIQKRIDAGFCELTGIAFDLNGSRSFNSPSIDRIDPSLGYTYDNIRIICFAMNSALGNWGEEILHAVVTSWIDKREREGAGFSGINAEIFAEDNRQTSIDLI